MGAEFLTSRRVRFCDTDLAGVMHFSNYFRVMEDVEHEFWRSLGLNVIRRDGDAHLSWPRKSVSFVYHKPARFEDEIQCHLQVSQVGDRSITYRVAFTLNNEPVAEGKTTMVCCRMQNQTFQSCPIPDDIREKFEGLGK